MADWLKHLCGQYKVRVGNAFFIQQKVMSVGVWVILLLAVLLQLLLPTHTHGQLTWKGGLKYLVSPPFKRHQQMQQEDGYDDDSSMSSGSREDLSLEKLVQKPTGRWW